MTDRRKKTCPNEECEVNRKQIKLNASEFYCKKCGTPLVLVCSSKNCYHPIEDRGPKHTMCEHCKAAHDERIRLAKEKAENLGKKIVAPAVIVVPAALKKINKDVTKKAVDALAKNAEAVIDKVPEKALHIAKEIIKRG